MTHLSADARAASPGAVDKAAGCYELQVEMHSKLGSFLECAMAYKEAGSMFEKAEKPNGDKTQR